jgi:hypothetical protein
MSKWGMQKLQQIARAVIQVWIRGRVSAQSFGGETAAAG